MPTRNVLLSQSSSCCGLCSQHSITQKLYIKSRGRDFPLKLLLSDIIRLPTMTQNTKSSFSSVSFNHNSILQYTTNFLFTNQNLLNEWKQCSFSKEIFLQREDNSFLALPHRQSLYLDNSPDKSRKNENISESCVLSHSYPD